MKQHLFESVGGPLYDDFIADSSLPVSIVDSVNFQWSMGKYKRQKHKNVISIQVQNITSSFVEVRTISFKLPRKTTVAYGSEFAPSPSPLPNIDTYNQCTYCILLNWNTITFNGTEYPNNTFCLDYTQCTDYANNGHSYETEINNPGSCICCHCAHECCSAEPSGPPNPIHCLYTDIARFCKGEERFIGIIFPQITADKKMVSPLINTISMAFLNVYNARGIGYMRHGFASRYDNGAYDLYFAISLSQLNGREDIFLGIIANFGACEPLRRCTGERNRKEHCGFRGGLLYKIFNKNKMVC